MSVKLKALSIAQYNLLIRAIDQAIDCEKSLIDAFSLPYSYCDSIKIKSIVGEINIHKDNKKIICNIEKQIEMYRKLKKQLNARASGEEGK